MPNNYLPPITLTLIQTSLSSFLDDWRRVGAELSTSVEPTADHFAEWLIDNSRRNGAAFECVRHTIELSGVLPPMPYYANRDWPRYLCADCHGSGWQQPDVPCPTCAGEGRCQDGPAALRLTDEQAAIQPPHQDPRAYHVMCPPLLAAANNAYHYMAGVVGRIAALGATPDTELLTLLDQLATALTAANGLAPTDYLDYKARTEAALGLAISAPLNSTVAGR